MFKRIAEAAATVNFEFEGENVVAADGDSVASALLAHGVRHMRDSAVSGSPRSAYCLIGVCFECLVEIDGRPNRQACMTPVREGMRVRRQRLPLSDGVGSPAMDSRGDAR
ncbi:MAG: (2Fe-2S)-binding protein [Geminicoccaceae bacterium]|nr:(2Fe-2S)-binding protein [Geminicoccaceae bacterium]